MVGKIPWRRKWQPTPVFLPGESHGQRSLVGYSPRGHKESNVTERLHFLSFYVFCIIRSQVLIVFSIICIIKSHGWTKKPINCYLEILNLEKTVPVCELSFEELVESLLWMFHKVFLSSVLSAGVWCSGLQAKPWFLILFHLHCSWQCCSGPDPPGFGQEGRGEEEWVMQALATLWEQSGGSLAFVTPVTLLLFHLSTHCHGHTLDLVSSPHPLILCNFYFFIYFAQLLPRHLFFKLVKIAKILASPWSPFLLTFLLADMKRCLPTSSCGAEAAGALPMSSWIPFTV